MGKPQEKMAKEKKKGHRKKLTSSLMELIEVLAFAIVVAAIIKTFIIQVYIIPTGSMAPTLHGLHKNVVCQRCGYEFARGTKRDYPAKEAICPICNKMNDVSGVRVSKGDKLLATNFIYQLKNPQRWDPVIFKYPRNPVKDFIKRLIALPGETLEIRNGDIYINGAIASKPLRVQQSIWMPVHDINHPRKDGKKFWRTVSGAWSEEKGALRVTGLSENRAEAVFRHQRIYDLYGYNSNGLMGGGGNQVGDLKVSADISFTGGEGVIFGWIAEFVVSQSDDIRNIFSFEVRVEPQRTAVALLKNLQEKTLRELDAPLSPEKHYHVEFMNYDDKIIFIVDGEVVASFDDISPINNRDASTTRSAVALGAKALRVDFGDLKIWRDIYYTRIDGGISGQNSGRITIPPGKYWVMGDNSPESSDSRYWGFVPANALEGRALLIWWPPQRIKIIR